MGGGYQSLARAARWSHEAVLEPMLTVLFPPRCVCCGDFESHLCPRCRDTLDRIGPEACPRCGEPGPRPLVGGRCAQCMGNEFPFAGARAAFRHEGAARRLVAEFKFGGQPVLGRLMADLARPAFKDFTGRIAAGDRLLVTWVPSHRRVQRERGYNQAEVLAKELARDSGSLERAALARKVRATKHQKGLGRASRQENLRDVFVLDEKASARVPPRCEAVILVDDVYTTGATAREVSSVLISGIGLPVHVFTFSRAIASAPERHD